MSVVTSQLVILRWAIATLAWPIINGTALVISVCRMLLSTCARGSLAIVKRLKLRKRLMAGQ